MEIKVQNNYKVTKKKPCPDNVTCSNVGNLRDDCFRSTVYNTVEQSTRANELGRILCLNLEFALLANVAN